MKRNSDKGLDRNDVALVSVLLFTFLSLHALTIASTGLTVDETRFLAQAKARAYSMYAAATGHDDLFFCDLRGNFTGTQWETRCWEGRPKLAVTISGIGWAAAFAASGGNMDIITSVAAHRMSLVLFSALGLVALYLLVREGYNRRAALLSGISFIFIPVIFTHSKYVLINGAGATMWILSAFVLFRARKDWRYGLLFGPVLGIALTSTAQLFFFPIVAAVWIAVSYRDKVAGRSRHIISPLRKIRSDALGSIAATGKRIPVAVYSTILLAPLFMLAAWPWLIYDTAERFSWFVSYYTHGAEAGPSITYFMGASHVHVPFFYPPLLTAAILPIPILLFALAGATIAIRHTMTLENRLSLFVLLSAGFLILFFSVIGVAYGGVRQFIEAFPFIAALSGIGADAVLSCKCAGKHKKRMRLILAAAVALIAVPGLVSIALGHTESYYSEAVGGAGGVYASGLFDPTWSGEPYLDAIYWLNENAEPGARVYIPVFPNIFTTYQEGDIGQITGRMDDSDSGGLPSGFSFEQDGLLRKDITVIGYYEAKENPALLDDADYVVLMSMFSLYDTNYFNGFSDACVDGDVPVHSVMYYGAPLVRVYRTPCEGWQGQHTGA